MQEEPMQYVFHQGPEDKKAEKVVFHKGFHKMMHIITLAVRYVKKEKDKWCNDSKISVPILFLTIVHCFIIVQLNAILIV